jgi:DNA-binding NarL/FixJ family response regulator
MTEPAPTRVIVVDDQAMIRHGISLMLSTAPDIEVVGEAGDGREAVATEAALRPDVVLMDIRMPGMDGIAATRAIAAAATDRPAPSVLVLTTFDHDEYVADALSAGASGFLLKDASTDELVAAVRTVARGDAVLDPSLTRRFVEDYLARRSAPAPAADQALVAQLTAREREIVVLLAQGRSNLELADALVLSEQTVKTHIRNILSKLHLRDRTQIVVFAFRNGLDSPPGT